VRRLRRAAAISHDARMRKFLVVMFLFGLAACKGGGSGIEKDMNGFKEKMCKCADKACADKTLEEYNAWAKGKRDEAKSMPKDQKDKLDAIDKEIKACRRKLRDEASADKPAGDTAAPAAPAAPADKPADK
jgi:hypothetical protein